MPLEQIIERLESGRSVVDTTNGIVVDTTYGSFGKTVLMYDSLASCSRVVVVSLSWPLSGPLSWPLQQLQTPSAIR